MNTSTPTGTLYLVPTPLDFGCEGADIGLTSALPAHTIEVASGLTHWITENAKSTRAFLKRVGNVHTLVAPLQEQHITELPRQVHKKGDHDSHNSFDASPLLAAALQGQDIPVFTVHDLRRTASTLLHENGWPSDVVEKALNHSVGGVRGIYNRAEYSSQRKEMLQYWADYIDDQLAHHQNQCLAHRKY